jgi:pimeloyl-ACP methyl ester carboxylesterase
MKSISLKRISVIFAILLPIFYLAVCFLLFFTQRSLLYFPTPESKQSQSISIESEGETLRILTRPADSANAIILFGGNADDVSYYLGSFAAAVPEQNLFLVNYRGYGGSTGSPSEAALFADAVAVYDHVYAKFPNVSVVGRSLGTGVAVYLASVRKVDRLILITPYDSVENVAKNHFPIFPVGLILKDKFDSIARVKDVTAKTLILLAENDRTIPRKNSDALAHAFRSDQVLVKTLAGKTHDSITSGTEYLELIRDFVGSED